MDNEDSRAFTVICNAKFVSDIFQAENVGNGILMEPTFTIVADVSFGACGKGSAIAMDGHRVLGFPSFERQVDGCKIN